MQGLREVLETAEDEEDDAPPHNDIEGFQVETEPYSYGAGSFTFCHIAHGAGNKLPAPTYEAQIVLFGLYQERVDAIYKIVHWPTIVAEVGPAVSQRKAISSSAQALQYSIYFMSLCTLTDEETRERGLGPKQEVIEAYRSAAETLLARTKVLEKPDVTALQALVIYLVSDTTNSWVRIIQTLQLTWWEEM